MSLVLSGNMKIPLEEAEQMKMDVSNHRTLFPIIRPVLEKMALITKKHIQSKGVEKIYLCGGTCLFSDMELVFEDEIGIPAIKPKNPFLVTPIGIALNCY